MKAVGYVVACAAYRQNLVIWSPKLFSQEGE